MKYTNTKYLWLEKDLDKKIILKEPEKEKITFDENEFKILVNPLLQDLIKSFKEEHTNEILNLKKLLHEEEQRKQIQNISVNSTLPLWVPITVSILATSIIFLFIIILHLIFK